MKNILLLGGTADARIVAKSLAQRDDVRAIISLAGVTSTPPDFGLEKRIGGFGGVEGLCNYIRVEKIDVLIDATHPYAVHMSRHAALAADETGITRLALERPQWHASDGDHWTEYGDWDDLFNAIPQDARVFLTAGQDGMRAFDRPRGFTVLARALEEPQGLNHDVELIKSLPLKSAEEEIALLSQYRITHLVSKNSGGRSSMAKLDAARHLGIPVLMLARPPMPEGKTYPDAGALLAEL